ncbi:unnamed protein product [Rhizophagus irregularis]|nr:unnamed protein product [Rhizophagus irregularis]
MQEVVQGTVSSFGTELSPGLEFMKGNWHSDLEFFCERERLRFGLDYERGRVFLILGLQRLLFAAIGYWTSEWANKMQLLG